MPIEIKSRWDGKVLFSAEVESLKLAVELAVKSKIDLSWANLSEANLSWANLSEANLSWANLSETNLSEADLFGKKIEKNPLQFLGEKWDILITAHHIKIGCQIHRAKEWENFRDKEISEFHEEALDWWKKWKPVIMQMHKIHAEKEK